jgi:hypothetical protein
MLLDYIPTLLKRQSDWRYAGQVYEEMLAAWIQREQTYFADQGASLLEVSERLAVDLYLNRASRGSETIDPDELEPLAAQFGFHLKKWQFNDWRLPSRSELRSLLSRYALFSGVVREGVWCVASSEFVPLPTAIGSEEETDNAVRAGSVLLTRELYSRKNAPRPHSA